MKRKKAMWDWNNGLKRLLENCFLFLAKDEDALRDFDRGNSSLGMSGNVRQRTVVYLLLFL